MHPKRIAITRRTLLTGAAGTSLLGTWSSRTTAAGPPLRVGMSAAFTGPAQALGRGMRIGIEAAFAEQNAAGGIAGRRLQLVARDDAYEPSRTAPNMRELIDQDDVFTVLGNVGTPTAAVAVPIAQEKGVPLWGAFTGAGLLRNTPPDRYVINYRASYAQEMAQLIDRLLDETPVRPEQGRVRLDYMARVASLDATTNPAARTRAAREITRGVNRAAYDALQDLRPATNLLGMQLARIGLCNDLDALNSIVANELTPTVGSVRRRMDDLEELVRDDDARAAEVAGLRQRFGELSARATGASESSLRGLRRAILEEVKRAAKTREAFQATARTLRAEVHRVQDTVDEMVAELEAGARTSTSRSQWAALLGGLLALVGVVVALRRISGSVEELRRTNAELLRLRDSLRQANAGLESKVAERTQALARREMTVRRLLNGLTEGVIEVAFDGTLSDERSRVVEKWFGAPEPGQPAGAYLFAGDEQGRLAFDLGLEQLEDDILPLELCLDQMPSRLHLGQRVLELRYRPMLEAGQTRGLLVIIEDISSKLEAEQAQRQAQEFQRLVQQVLHDQEGFLRFVDDSSSLLERIRAGRTPEEIRMPLHTLKGNCAVFGAGEVATLCHELETRLEEARVVEANPRVATTAELRELEQAWEDMLSRTAVFCRSEADNAVLIPRKDLEALAVNSLRLDEGLAREIEQWLLDPCRAELARLGRHVTRLAERLNKLVDVDIRDHGLRTSPGFAHALYAELVHVIRNAIDHGIEPPEARQVAGKDRRAVLALSTELTDGGAAMLLQVTDDGRGIDWDKIRSAARKRGMPHAQHEDLVDALFASGVSTTEAVSDISGRGVGMSAVRAACEALGGTIEVHSKPGLGTTFMFRLPLPDDVKVYQEPASRAGPSPWSLRPEVMNRIVGQPPENRQRKHSA